METAPTWKPDQTVAVKEKADTFQPYDHQNSAWDALERYFTRDKKSAGILVVPTGGGKTTIASRWLLRHHISQGRRVLWLAHRRGLLIQAFNDFLYTAHLAQPRDRLSLAVVSSWDIPWSAVSPDHDVVFSTIQSAGRTSNQGFIDALAHQSREGLVVVVDEAHHAAAPLYRALLTQLKERGCPLLGLSATPVRMDPDDEKRLWNLFDGVIYNIDKKTLIAAGILAQPHTETVETKVDFEREFTKEDYDHLVKYGELGPKVLARIAKHSGRNKLIVSHYVKNRLKYGKTIVFAADILHAQTLAKEFKENDVPADYVDYTRGDSAAVMDAYRDRQVPVVITNVEMLTEGYDAPKTRTAFIARPTRSQALLSQMIGRALRGPRAAGPDKTKAYLVTFVDTWKMFHILDTEVVVRTGAVEEAVTKERTPAKLVPIAHELVLEAYRLVQSAVRGDFLGIHECLPHSWYSWQEQYEDDIQHRLVLVFNNQVEGFKRLLSDLEKPGVIPEDLTEPVAEELVQEYFGDTQDPLPRWPDVVALLNAKRRGIEVSHYTFEEKAAFDPRQLALKIRDENLGEHQKEALIVKLFETNPVCNMVYKGVVEKFFEEVDRELRALRTFNKPAPPEIVEIVPKTLRTWSVGERGHQLVKIWDDVAETKIHFPHGLPSVREFKWSRSSMKGRWGFFRYSDRTVQINRILDSPDVPRFVLEFLVYHEVLHADMPNAHHNAEFRERERRFTPSEAAKQEAGTLGITPGIAPDAWRVLADQFLDTFLRRFSLSDGEGRMLV